MSNLLEDLPRNTASLDYDVNSYSVSDWLISKKFVSSKTALPNESKHGRKHPSKVYLVSDWPI
jgi:hypothetical protein